MLRPSFSPRLENKVKIEWYYLNFSWGRSSLPMRLWKSTSLFSSLLGVPKKAEIGIIAVLLISLLTIWLVGPFHFLTSLGQISTTSSRNTKMIPFPYFLLSKAGVLWLSFGWPIRYPSPDSLWHPWRMGLNQRGTILNLFSKSNCTLINLSRVSLEFQYMRKNHKSEKQ